VLWNGKPVSRNFTSLIRVSESGNRIPEIHLKNLSAIRTLLLLCLLGISLGTAHTQLRNSAHEATADPLFQTISALDKQLFDAVNRCDMAKVASFWAEDVEFYHDKDGLTIGREKVVASIKNNLCGKMKRELVPGTLEVYPLNGYGAVEIGVHRFLHPWAQDHGVVGEAKFIHVWQQSKDGQWKITRVISYDHGLAK
jgi:ketosteroid isomerase-like protein